jgi:hypothetical protein
MGTDKSPLDGPSDGLDVGALDDGLRLLLRSSLDPTTPAAGAGLNQGDGGAARADPARGVPVGMADPTDLSTLVRLLQRHGLGRWTEPDDDSDSGESEESTARAHRRTWYTLPSDSNPSSFTEEF